MHDNMVRSLSRALSETTKEEVEGAVEGWLENGLAELLLILVRKQGVVAGCCSSDLLKDYATLLPTIPN